MLLKDEAAAEKMYPTYYSTAKAMLDTNKPVSQIAQYLKQTYGPENRGMESWHAQPYSTKDLVTLEELAEYSEAMNYCFILHAQRMILVLKLITKSAGIREVVRTIKQKSASQKKSEGKIEMDLF